jgi:hypothetical protein
MNYCAKNLRAEATIAPFLEPLFHFPQVGSKLATDRTTGDASGGRGGRGVRYLLFSGQGGEATPVDPFGWHAFHVIPLFIQAMVFRSFGYSAWRRFREGGLFWTWQ